MADMSVSGIASGINWDEMITKILNKAKKPALVMVEKRDTLSRKKEYFEEFKIALQKLNSALSPLKLPSTYKAKGIEIDRIDKSGSYKGVLTATVNADAEVNVHDLEVLKLAKSQVQRSNSFSGTLGAGGVFSGPLNGLNQSAFWIGIGGRRLRIEVHSDDTLESLAKRINMTLKTQKPPFGVTASVVDKKLILKSDATGLGEDTRKVSMTRSSKAYDLLGDTYIDPRALKDLVVKSKKGDKTWKRGVDFDIVAGNRIRWRDYEPQTVPAGATYQVKYKAKSGDVYTTGGATYGPSDIVRGKGNVDKDALPFTPQVPTNTSIKDKNGVTYQYGTDFKIEGKSVKWLGTNRPDEGVAYKVTYEPAANEEFTLNVKRGVDDEITMGTTTYEDFAKGKSVIKQGDRTYVQGEDFDIVSDGGSPAKAVVRWRPEAAWGAPGPGTPYNLELTKSDGTTQNFNVTRTDKDKLTMSEWGFTTATGTIEPTATYVYQDPPTTFGTGTFSPSTISSTQTFTLTWTQPSTPPVPRTDPPGNGTGSKPITPRYGDEYTVEYKHEKNTFTLSDDGTGILGALGLDRKDEAHYTAAEDAEMILNGEKVTRSSNKIGPEYKNELLKGVTMELKGLGHVSMDISHDLEASVKAIQAFTEAYNDVMKWINVKSSEKAVDETKKATLPSNDFRMKWGLLFGNSLLREAKGRMRRSVTQTFSHTFKQRKSRDPIYGTMEQNGLKGQSSLRITVGARTAEITVRPEDTLESIAARINDTSQKGEASALHYDPDGRKYPTPFAKASVSDGKLVIDAGTDRQVQVSGTPVLKALGMDYTYTGLYQMGLKTTSTDHGKSGELEFNSRDYMKAMTKNSEEATDVMLAFAKDMQTFADGMLRSSAASGDSGKGAAKGAVVRAIDGIDTEIKSINKYLNTFEQRLQKKKETLFKRFSEAERNLSKLMQQASWLNNVTAQLQGAGKSQQ